MRIRRAIDRRLFGGARAAALSAAAPKKTWVEPGHFYSPIPSCDELRPRLDRIFGPSPPALRDVDVNRAGQLEILELVVAREKKRVVAGAINFINGRGLFGRHWGELEKLPHFNVCYYRRVLRQGPRRPRARRRRRARLSRGFEPTIQLSAPLRGPRALP